MVHSIGIKICVEGVEKSEWSHKLRNMEVDYLQGYLFGKPCEKNIFIDTYRANC